MSDSLGDLLNRGSFKEPPEIDVIKKFVHEHTGITPQVAMTPKTFVVSMPSASAAGTLRFKLFQLQRSMGHTRKIIIKIV
jgi:hypothetical protein